LFLIRSKKDAQRYFKKITQEQKAAKKRGQKTSHQTPILSLKKTPSSQSAAKTTKEH
jgi:hypothetical protein